MFVVKDANLTVEALDANHSIVFIKDPPSMTHVEHTPLREQKTIVTQAAFKRCYERASSSLAMTYPSCLLAIYDHSQYPIKNGVGSTRVMHEDGFVAMCYVHQYAHHQLSYANEHEFIEVFENIRALGNFADVVANRDSVFGNAYNIYKDGGIRGLLYKYQPLLEAVDRYDAEAFHKAYNDLLQTYSTIFSFQEPSSTDFYEGIKTLYKLLDDFLKTKRVSLDNAINDETLRSYLMNTRDADRRAKVIFWNLLTGDRKSFLEFYKATIVHPSLAVIEFTCSPGWEKTLVQKVISMDPVQQAQKLGFYYTIVSTNFNTDQSALWKSLGFVRSRNGGDTIIREDYSKRVLDGEVEIMSRPRKIIHTLSRKIDPVIQTPRGGSRRGRQ